MLKCGWAPFGIIGLALDAITLGIEVASPSPRWS